MNTIQTPATVATAQELEAWLTDNDHGITAKKLVGKSYSTDAIRRESMRNDQGGFDLNARPDYTLEIGSVSLPITSWSEWREAVNVLQRVAKNL